MSSGNNRALLRIVVLTASLIVGAACGQGLLSLGYQPAAAFQYLAQQFATPVEIWSTQLENSSYAGAAFRVHRTDNDVETDIPFSGGKYASVTSFNTACSGTTCLLAKVYGQMGACDLVQATKANMPSALVDTDSRLTFQGAASRFLSTSCTTVKTAKVHYFGVMYPGYINDTTRNSYTFWRYPTLRLGLDLTPSDTFAVDGIRNGSNAGYTQAPTYGNAHLGGTTGYHVWDYQNNTTELRHDTIALTPGIATADVTYPGTTALYVGNDDANGSPFLGKWRMITAYGTDRADRDSISTFLISDFAITPLPTTTSTADGFTYTPQYFPSFDTYANDIFNLTCTNQSGGYPWSVWLANNLNNAASATLRQFSVHQGDDDTIISDAERSEFNCTINGTKITKGGAFDIIAQFNLAAGPTQTGSWSDTFQVHYDGGASPDLFLVSLLNDQLQIITQRNGASTNRGSAQALTRGVTYAIRFHGSWSSGGTTDVFQVEFGTNGSTLTQIVNASGSIFSTDTAAAALKMGIYRGNPGENTGAITIQVMNYQASTTNGTFSGFVASQTALPAHNFLLKRDLDPASNDNDPMWMEKAA